MICRPCSWCGEVVGRLAWRTERGDFAKVVSMLAGPPSIRYFDGVDT
ncbi:MAG: hypothetical protein ACRDZ7_01485 [Acidimicrobiia bacterium]